MKRDEYQKNIVSSFARLEEINHSTEAKKYLLDRMLYLTLLNEEILQNNGHCNVSKSEAIEHCADIERLDSCLDLIEKNPDNPFVLSKIKSCINAKIEYGLNEINLPVSDMISPVEKYTLKQLLNLVYDAGLKVLSNNQLKQLIEYTNPKK